MWVLGKDVCHGVADVQLQGPDFQLEAIVLQYVLFEPGINFWDGGS